MSKPTAPDTDSAVWTRISNDGVDWDQFDSAAYFDHNYGSLRDDDRHIIEIVSDFFQEQKRRYPDQWRHKAIDVGAGANLYPALTMLPFAAEITLYERAATNCDWLQRQKAEPNESWWQFWSEMTNGRDDYRAIKDPLNLLSRRAQVKKGNIFNLPEDEYDMGTMFFVAESITNRDDEFKRALRTFIGSLRNHAPFAAAFMKDSSGYRVGNITFPAFSVGEQDIERQLSELARDVSIRPIESNGLRDGYGGMIVATGRRKK
ncbi:SCO2525 family SAM-dependent methyltransferase [Actinoplanes sp. TFC3]|uniref:SCO2525 family SAM-dependent methyltransferase n=1 Tax=Actinoplanes sp. TFC3 TaxID=1710355 RepID=UPI000AA2E90B|nr:SCO2525 family SAM-dependent methyltransferase [Actinoplanes sp. TFC3]